MTALTSVVTLTPLLGFPEVRPGDDLVELVLKALQDNRIELDEIVTPAHLREPEQRGERDDRGVCRHTGGVLRSLRARSTAAPAMSAVVSRSFIHSGRAWTSSRGGNPLPGSSRSSTSQPSRKSA